MNTFITDDFLLTTPTSRNLYHTYAAPEPIIDYHCHIDPREIYEDRRFENITQVWLGGDHYKWRLMRAAGIPERLITGDGGDYEKFRAFAKILPNAVGNPVYHWAHLELLRYFDCKKLLSDETADEIWTLCNEKLQNGLTVRNIIKSSNVIALNTTDDPLDTLEWHKKLADDPSFGATVKPAWRPDSLMGIDKPAFGEYIGKLGNVSSMATLRDAIIARMNHFDAHGCRASDHGLDGLVHVPATEAELNVILAKALQGAPLTDSETFAYQYALLRFMGAEYARRGWVMELHYGAIRNINTPYFKKLGADTGYDAIAASITISGLPGLLNELYTANTLPRTLLFSLDPNHNTMLSTIAGGFQLEGKRGWVQHGAAWWFNDTKAGITEQLSTFANITLLSNFLGMVTDSRSFLSYTRHEYFRRVLCSLIGGWVESGEYPNDPETLGQIVRSICVGNAKEAFGF